MRKSLAMAILSIFVLTGAASMLSACNTTAGLGKDVSAVGKNINRDAEKAK